MKTTALAVLAGVAIGFGGSVAMAKPTDVKKQNNKPTVTTQTIKMEMPAQEDFFDDFESYKPGSDIVGQGGWELWYSGGETAEVSSDEANSGQNSMKIRSASDIVQRFTAEDGKWTFSVQTYVPSTSTGEGYVIMMNQYGDISIDNWSVQVQFNPFAGIVQSQSAGGVNNDTALITDAWVELRCEIDLDADTLNIYYNDTLFAADLIWSENVSGNGKGITSIANTDLYSSSINVMYFDDVSLVNAGGGECYPDCNGDTILDFFDFLCYLNAFDNEDPYADCEANGVFDFFDFLCYLNAFDADC